MERRTLEKDFEKGIYLKGVCCKNDSLEYMTLMGADDLVRLFEAFVSGKDELKEAVMAEFDEHDFFNGSAEKAERVVSRYNSGKALFGWQNEEKLRSFANVLTEFTGIAFDVAVYLECGLYLVSFFEKDKIPFEEASMELVNDMAENRRSYEMETMMW